MGKCSTEIMQALAFALRWCDEHPNWISVKDELSVENDIVLTANNRGGVSMGYYTDDEWRNIMFTDEKSPYPITHWMPRPSTEHLKKEE